MLLRDRKMTTKDITTFRCTCCMRVYVERNPICARSVTLRFVTNIVTLSQPSVTSVNQSFRVLPKRSSRAYVAVVSSSSRSRLATVNIPDHCQKIKEIGTFVSYQEGISRYLILEIVVQ